MEPHISLDGQNRPHTNSSSNSSSSRSSHTLGRTPNRQVASDRSQSVPDSDPTVSDGNVGQDNASAPEDDMRASSIPQIFDYHEDELAFEYLLFGMTEQDVLLQDPLLDLENTSYAVNSPAGGLGLGQENTSSIYGNANFIAEEEPWVGLAMEEGTASEILNPMANPKSDGSEKTAFNRDGSSTIDTLISPTSRTLMNSPTNSRLRKIASKTSTKSVVHSGGITKKPNKTKRKSFKSVALKEETSLTRTLNSCIKCRGMRNRCVPNPDDLDGPCLTCMKLTSSMTRLPCLRYKITDINLYRTAFQHFEFFRVHLMIGPTYGDFHISREWLGTKTKALEIAQDSNVILRLQVREFVPQNEELVSDDARGNKMYGIPWAIANPDEAAKAANDYVDQNMDAYLETVLDDSNRFVFDVFHWALRLTIFPQPNELLSNVLRLWVACRFLEGRWRCCGPETFGAEELSHRYERDPIVQVPPFINYQVAAVFTQRVLEPLRIVVLKQLQTLILAKKSSNWFVTFLAVFILLHNYELQCSFHRGFARRRKFQVRFVDMPIIRAILMGSKIILAHFHFCCKGQRPFSAEFDWESTGVKRMAQLDVAQIEFLKQYRVFVLEKAEKLRAVSQTDDYEAETWFTAQLFDSEWEPRQTNEHSLPA